MLSRLEKKVSKPAGIFFGFFSLQDYEGGWRGGMGMQRIENDAFRLGRDLAESYLDERHRIPPGHLHELRYDDLVRNPEAEMEKLYSSLSLGGFESYLPHLRDGLREREGYQTNLHSDPSDLQQKRLRQEWSRYYEAFGY